MWNMFSIFSCDLLGDDAINDGVDHNDDEHDYEDDEEDNDML